jgi:hypothetical protein
MPSTEKQKQAAQKSQKGVAGDSENQLGFEGL